MRHLELEHGFDRASHEIECPFCQEHISGGYASHLARHLEEVSLTILPADAESDEDSDRDSDEASDEEEARRENTLTPRYGPVGDYPFDQDPFHHRNLTSENNPMPKENSDRNSDEASDKEEARKINTPTPRYGPVGAYPFDQHPFHRHNPTSENGSPVLAIMKMPKHDLPSNDIGKSAISHEELVPVDTEDEESYIIKCICNSTEDDGNTIYCEACDTWQHIHCYYSNNVEDALKLEFAHSCVECKPRVLKQAISRMYQEIYSRKWKCPLPSCMYRECELLTEEDLGRHLKESHSHNPSLFECPLCPSVFHGQDGFLKHIKSHDVTHNEIQDGTYAPTETDGEVFGQTMPNNGAAENIDAGQLDATAQKTDAITGKSPADIIKAEDSERVEAGDVSTQAALHREVSTADQTIDSEETVTAARRTLGDRLNASLRDGRGKRMF